MKVLAALASLASVSSATLLISKFGQANMTIGTEYQFDYTFDKSYTAELLLIKKGTAPPVEWTSVMTLFSEKKIKPCSGSYKVTPNDTWPTSDDGSEFALWISGMEKDGEHGYSDSTEYFKIYRPHTKDPWFPSANELV